MASTAGWVYVLANSSMPGLIKVGKTSKNPDQRAAELSKVTGVATPFMVVFEQYFEDCDGAEDYVHAELERRNLRISGNREFFKAAANEAIRVVMLAVEQDFFKKSATPKFEVKAPIDQVKRKRSKEHANNQAKPWVDVLPEARKYFIGRDNYIRDARVALRFFKDAARLGSIEAYQHIGWILANGDGVPRDEAAALDYFRIGVSKGNYYCYAEMAYIYMSKKSEAENEEKCWRIFFEESDKPGNPQVENMDSFVGVAAAYIYLRSFQSKPISMDKYLKPIAGLLKLQADLMQDEDDGPAGRAASKAVRDWVSANCS